MKAQVITASSRRPHESYYFLDQFEASAARHGIVPHFLNEGPWLGLMTKPKHLLKYIEREGSKFDYLIMVDSWDVIWMTPLDEILYNYKAFGNSIVFNAEKSCFPRSDLAERHPESTTPYRFLNSGFVIGPTERILSMLREMRLETVPDDKLADGTVVNTNDQAIFMAYYVENQSKIRLDTLGVLCQSLHGSEPNEFEFLLEKQRVRSRETGNSPCVFHGNGSGKAALKQIIDWLKL